MCVSTAWKRPISNGVTSVIAKPDRPVNEQTDACIHRLHRQLYHFKKSHFFTPCCRNNINSISLLLKMQGSNNLNSIPADLAENFNNMHLVLNAASKCISTNLHSRPSHKRVKRCPHL